jgi:hypothetical protein
MGWGKKKSSASAERSSASKPPAWKTELKVKIRGLRRLEKQAFGPRHGKTDFWDYLKAVYNAWDWSDPKVSRQVSRRVAKLYNIKMRAGTTPIRTIIDATCDQDRQTKSKWAQALEYAIANKVRGNHFKAFVKENGGVAGCAEKMADLRKRKVSFKRP